MCPLSTRSSEREDGIVAGYLKELLSIEKLHLVRVSVYLLLADCIIARKSKRQTNNFLFICFLNDRYMI